jgi:hypothetical protein
VRRIIAADLDDLSLDEIPALLAQVASVQSALAARLAAAAPAKSKADPDHLLSIDDAVQRLAVTKDWLRRRPHLPFVVRLSEGVVRYSARGIAAFIEANRRKGT